MNKKRYFLTALLIVLSLGLFAGVQDTLKVLTTPQFAGAYYAAFARNYLGAEAAGRGYTGVALSGSSEMGLINPAVMRPDSVRVFVELDIKPSIAEPSLDFAPRYESAVPVGIVGIGMPLSSKMHLALCYSNPQSIVLKDYTIEINQGGQLIARQPNYELHQASIMANYLPSENLSFGLGVHNQLHRIRDSIFRHDFHRDDHNMYALRIQPGMLYERGNFAFGLSALLPWKINWELRHVDYQQVLPWEIKTGVSYEKGQNRAALDLGYRNYKAENELFKDEMSLGLGLERRDDNRIYRLGYMYKSGVWSGTILLPIHSNLDDVGDIWEWQETMTILSDEQHYLSAGVEYLFKDGSLNLSILQAAFGEVYTTHLQMGLNLRLSVFTRKREIRS
ncbi:MAG: hypothetical protein LHW60_00405 [Candidatus Cloacimonetes bacterium]|jgi:hypothetical protein|nr:hypothetical protein [Candidatus Cloacimonadota bacterium]NLO44707.1 hypothetical protein [Candidatus Cloacimonadota bacterium]